VAQNKALCIITGQYQSTPLEALRVEAGVESYSTVNIRKWSVSHERASQLLPEHLCQSPREPSITQVIHWLQRSSWHIKSQKLAAALPSEFQLCAPVTFTQQAPWIGSAGSCLE